MINIILLLGESGAGKSTLQDYICKKTNIKKIISYTTRRPRDGEANGKDYYFVSDDEFKELKNQGLFLETSEYSGSQKYGMLNQEYAKNQLAVVTPSGMRQILKKYKYNREEILVIYLKVDRASRLAKLVTTRKKMIDECIRRNVSDCGTFDGIENEVDIIVDNNEYRLSVEILYERIIDQINSFLKNNNIKNGGLND